MPEAKAAALKALEIDGTLAEAHTSLAMVHLLYDWDLAASEKEFRRAIELDPITRPRIIGTRTASFRSDGRRSR